MLRLVGRGGVEDGTIPHCALDMILFWFLVRVPVVAAVVVVVVALVLVVLLVVRGEIELLACFLLLVRCDGVPVL